VNAPLLTANLALTVLFLVATVLSGIRGKRRAHYVLVVVTIVMLLTAIAQAELFGRGYTFDPLRLNVHLGFAFTALGCLPGAIWSGMSLRTNPVRRQAHRFLVWSFVILTVLAVLTALWMLLSAVPLADPA
jgi:hypothetical protein